MPRIRSKSKSSSHLSTGRCAAVRLRFDLRGPSGSQRDQWLGVLQQRWKIGLLRFSEMFIRKLQIRCATAPRRSGGVHLNGGEYFLPKRVASSSASLIFQNFLTVPRARFSRSAVFFLFPSCLLQIWMPWNAHKATTLWCPPCC